MERTKVTLSLDILASIADALAAEDPPDDPALRALSLACKSLVTPCRRHLFSSVMISSNSWHIKEYSNLLRTAPKIARYVRDLVYLINPRTVGDDERSIVQILLHENSINTAGTNSRISTGRLCAIELISHGQADWNALPSESIRRPLESLVQLPSITHLKFRSFKNFPIGILAFCQNLIDIQVAEVLVPLTEPSSPSESRSEITHPVVVPPHTRIPTPISLCAQEQSNSILKPLMQDRIIDFSLLREASLGATTAGDIDVIIMFLKITTELESLDLSVTSPIPLVGLGTSLAPASSIGARQTLKSIIFSSEVTGGGYDPLCGLSTELKKFAAPGCGNNVLEELVVCVYVQTNMRCRTDSDDWADLDSVLTASGAFPLLRRVSVSLGWTFNGWLEYDIEGVLNQLTEDRFPRLVESTSVEFVFEETDHWL